MDRPMEMPKCLILGVLWAVGWFAAEASSAAAAPPMEGRFPLRVSENRRHLVDARGTPFLYHADTAWMLFLKLDEAEAAHYLRRRSEQGFNVVQVQLTGFLGMTNRAGVLPFEGGPDRQDLERPNVEFFAHVDRVVREAGRQGLLLAVAPLWSGCCGEGWSGRPKDGVVKPLNAVDAPHQAREFGRWLGRRYGSFPHLLWILGGDNDPGEARPAIRELGLGLKESAPRQLVTFHAASSHSSTDVWPAEEPWLDVSMVYTYFRGFNKAWNKNQPDVYEVSHAEYAKVPVHPYFLGESTYEGEHGDWGSALQVRKQAWWCVLGGGFGHAYGSPNWNFPSHWREVIDLPGAHSLRHLRTLLESKAWWRLVPDQGNHLAVDGRGTWSRNDAAITALADDASFAVSYLPSRRALTMDLARLRGPRIAATWFDPRTGEFVDAGASWERTPRAFEPNSDGDWVLVLESRPAAVGAPNRP